MTAADQLSPRYEVWSCDSSTDQRCVVQRFSRSSDAVAAARRVVMGFLMDRVGQPAADVRAQFRRWQGGPLLLPVCCAPTIAFDAYALLDEYLERRAWIDSARQAPEEARRELPDEPMCSAMLRLWLAEHPDTDPTDDVLGAPAWA